MNQAERIGWIDMLRAFAMFAIVLGHTLRNATVVYPWLSSFHVSLCVLTSGIVVGTFMTVGNGQVSYNADSYGKHGFVYFLAMAMLLCVGVVIVATCIPNGVKSIDYVGKNTVGIMVMHKFPILFFCWIISVE